MFNFPAKITWAACAKIYARWHMYAEFLFLEIWNINNSITFNYQMSKVEYQTPPNDYESIDVNKILK